MIRTNDSVSKQEKPSFLRAMLLDYLFKPSIWTSLSYLNIGFFYFVTIALVGGRHLSVWYGLAYIPCLYCFFAWRTALREKKRLQIAHRIPFFADSMANCLAIGATLEQAIINSSHNLKDEIKTEFDQFISLVALGKDAGKLLRKIDKKFPQTGLRFLISLMEEYRELGVGIGPILKKMAERLKIREEAEGKIQSILAAGSGYARLTVIIFMLIFIPMIFFLRDNFNMLFNPPLRPITIFLMLWTGVGITLVTRITSLEFTRHFALRPLIKEFMKKKSWTLDDLITYAGLSWPAAMRQLLAITPMILGFVSAYFISLFYPEPLAIFIGFTAATLLFRFGIEFVLKGLVEDQLVKLIEVFPELLQIFIIGLNTGLNTYLAFQFAQESVKDISPRLLRQELFRTKFAMECGESHTRTWQRFAEMLPFETVNDFCEIMVIAPMHGESIVQSIVQMANSYQEKKLTMMEKKAVGTGQMVIPLIVLSFFPLFLFIVFGPTMVKISATLAHAT